VLQQRPNSWVTYNQLGYTLHQQGKYQEALDKFRVASLAAPKSVMALGNMGEACLQVGKFEEGLGYLKKSAALDPTWDVAVSNISSALRYQGKYEEALPYARRATVLNSADDFNWQELGDCYSSLPRHQKEARNAYLRAAQEAERHLQTDGADGPTWMRLALYRIKTGNSREADALVKKAASLGASDVDSQICKARILELLGRRDQALATLSACFRRGVTTFDIALLPDLESLRGDVRYQEMARLRTQAAPVSHPS
jgi:tetratricopeptide (TPR) repeat protein